jgi:cobalt-precorrin-6B (C15)-methyltransferase
MNEVQWITPGIADEDFVRLEGVPMTKQEIRVLSLAKLRLFPGATVYDVGAGTGSIAIECKRLLPGGRVVAIERDPRAVEVIADNCRRFGVEIEVICGLAPEAMASLPPADRIFVGGSGQRLPELLETCHQKLIPGGFIVVNSVTMETGTDTYRILKARDYRLDVAQVNIAVLSSRGGAQLWQARNPVTIIAAQKRGESSAKR